MPEKTMEKGVTMLNPIDIKYIFHTEYMVYIIFIRFKLRRIFFL